MKTEAELRKLRDAIRKLEKQPCGCATTDHALECFVGGKMMKANEVMLSWVIGEASELDNFVENLLKRAAT